jgi:hypothetical protein
MKKLEITLEETSIEEKEEIKPLSDTGYKGLELMDEKIHYSGTSIKYWM